MGNGDETRERLLEYGDRLRAAGFKVWFTRTTDGGFLTYQRDGLYGTLQRSYHEGWQHLMPIKPSREYGSSMFIGEAVADPWTVEAAEQCASPTNHNDVVGRRPNAKHAWISPDAIALTDSDTDEGGE